jgi:hypothetical protein
VGLKKKLVKDECFPKGSGLVGFACYGLGRTIAPPARARFFFSCSSCCFVFLGGLWEG